MKDPEQTPKNKRWMIMIAVVIILFILYFIASYTINGKALDTDPQNPPPGSSVTEEPPATSQAQPKPEDNSIVDTSLLTAPVPEDATLAQEEISRLQDQQAQLAEHKVLLDQQLQDSDQLIELKEKYLADLQRQLDDQTV